MNAGLILAGGTAERLKGYDKPKQFIEVGGKLLISYCLEVFKNSPDIDLICVVVADEWRVILGDYIYAKPGKSRQHSIYSGLIELEQHKPDKVVIHDAARPRVTEGDIKGVIEASIGHDGATPVLPVSDTMYDSIDGRTISRTLDREGIFAGQTPECYDFLKYLEIHKNTSDDGLSKVKGSSEIAVSNNLKIAICKGSPENLKVTTKTDLEFFVAHIENSGEEI